MVNIQGEVEARKPPHPLPLVSVITPTWRRHDWLIGRCMPSVQAQTYGNIEQIIVSDGPDPELAGKLMTEYMARIYADAPPEPFAVPGAVLKEHRHPVMFDQLPEHLGEEWGCRGRLRGIELARGDLIAYLDDDDAYRPDHCALLVAALAQQPKAGLAYSQMASQGDEDGKVTVVGEQELGPCRVGTPMIMHRRALLDLATWGPPDSMEDWRLVERWLLQGVQTIFVPKITVDVWPSAYRGGW
jgi:cellulose synthase/poly-beta-1,6-N-acetylglucosamine synthase-like glycosyltransferase